MTCPACEAAKTDPYPGLLNANCRGCMIRALASSPTFFDASKSGKVTPAYRKELEKLNPNDWKTSHAEVKTEHDRIQALKKGAAP